MSIKFELLIFNCLKCNKNHEKDFNKDLIKRLGSTNVFCEREINKFCLILRKIVKKEIKKNLDEIS